MVFMESFEAARAKYSFPNDQPCRASLMQGQLFDFRIGQEYTALGIALAGEDIVRWDFHDQSLQLAQSERSKSEP